VFDRRTSLLNSTRGADVADAGRDGGGVHDAWNGWLGVQREVAIADRPVDVEIGLDGTPDLDFDIGTEDIKTPTGPRAAARTADLGENPHVPRPVKKTLEDDDWRAEGAMTYLYRRGFDVYDINTILSAGALGRGKNRRLVPTRWSITAVDDTVGQFLRGSIRDNPTVNRIEVHRNEYLGNAFWVILVPGQWEYELVEMKSPGSIWNPDPGAGVYLSAASEGREGRTGYVEERPRAPTTRPGWGFWNTSTTADGRRRRSCCGTSPTTTGVRSASGRCARRSGTPSRGNTGPPRRSARQFAASLTTSRSRSVASDENRRWRPDYRRTSATSSTPGERDGSEEQRSSRPIRFSPVVEWVGAWFPQFPRSAASPPVLNS